MSYGLKYTITQALRDGSFLNVNIYEKDYALSTVINYPAININLESNASNDEPLAGIISSQLNISFLTTEEDGVNFPDLLNFDIRKYFVKLYKTDPSNPIWVGFLFNDYVQVPFTTANIKVDMIAIDGLSFLQYSTYTYFQEQSINSLKKIIDVISEILNTINYPDPIKLLTSCSYYASGMLNRTDADYNEPFSQTYQYIRDYVDSTYYDALDNIMKSFGCRLFQSDGVWQILAINQMALSTRYYTKYIIYPTVSLDSSGTIDKNITIQPYSVGNVHFIDNSQNKIVRKGYPKIVIKNDFKYANNYVHNGNFQGYQNVLTPPAYLYKPYGWNLIAYGSGSDARLQIENDLSSNTVVISRGVGGGSYASAEMGFPPPYSPYLYLPYINLPGFDISFSYSMVLAKAKLFISIYNPATSITYYYNSSKNWQTSSTYIDVVKSAANTDYVNFSLSVDINNLNTPSGTSVLGYVKLKFLVDGSGSFPSYEDISIRAVTITQKYSTIKSVSVTRQVGTENTIVKEIQQPFGSFLNNYTVNNNIGNLVDSSGISYINWYNYPNTSITYQLLTMLMARQYSNLLNVNFGTLEGDLGKFETSKGLNYLDKVYSIQDSPTNAVSYNNKIFILNRCNINAQIDEVNSLQLIEITNTNNDSTETIKYNIE